MSDVNRQTSYSIQQQSQTLAQIIVTRLYEADPGKWGHFDEKHVEKSIRDTIYHLTYLAQAITVDSPLLLIEYIAWCKTLFSYLGFTDDVLVDTLRCIRQVISENLVEEQSAVACTFIDAALENLPTVVVTPPSFLLSDEPLGKIAQEYFQALLHKNRPEASQLILNAAQQGMRIQDIYLHVLQPCQRELGRLWHMNHISVGQEHYATAITQSIMAQLYPYLFASAPATKRASIVISCVAGDLHELGARMLADFFEMDGWDSYFLGASTPAKDIIEATRTRKAAILCLSATAMTNVDQVSNVIALLRKSPDLAQTHVLVGGYPFNQVPDLWQKIGADGYAPDAQTALNIARKLLEEK